MYTKHAHSSIPTFSRRGVLACTGSLAASSLIQACSSPFHGLRQWYHAYSEPGVRQAVVEVAQHYPHIPVQVEWIAGDYDRKSAVTLLSGNPPDIIEMAQGPSVDTIQAHKLTPLTRLSPQISHDFNSTILDSVTWKDDLYGIPQTIDAQLLFYRPSILRKFNVSVPRTLEELVHVATTISNDTTKGLFLGNTMGSQLAAVLLRACGAHIVHSSHTDILSPHCVYGLSLMQELSRSDCLLVGSPIDWFNPAALTTGLAAMQICGTWAIPEMEKVLGTDVAAVPFPRLSSTVGQPAIQMGSYVSVISHASQYHAQAQDYMKWLWIENTDFQLQFAQDFGLHIPVRASLLHRAQKWKKTPLRQGVLSDVQRYGCVFSRSVFTPTIRQALSDSYTHVVREFTDPLESLKKIAPIIDRELSRIHALR